MVRLIASAMVTTALFTGWTITTATPARADRIIVNHGPWCRDHLRSLPDRYPADAWCDSKGNVHTNT